MKKKKKSISKTKLALWVVVVLIPIVTIINSVLVICLYRRNMREDRSHIGSLVMRAVDDLSKPTVTDPISGKAYLPEAHLVLPASSSDLGDVAYNYAAPSQADGLGEEVHVSSIRDIHQVETSIISANDNVNAVFGVVPKLQACARGVRITYQLDPSSAAYATKTLANGKKVYFYTEDVCKNTLLMSYVQQIDSY